MSASRSTIAGLLATAAPPPRPRRAIIHEPRDRCSVCQKELTSPDDRLTRADGTTVCFWCGHVEPQG